MKNDIGFECRECGAKLFKWMGRCPHCEQWNSIVEINTSVLKKEKFVRNRDEYAPVPLVSVAQDINPRLLTGISELDRVLGGGLVSKSMVLVGGDPGVGKSTLLMQALGKIAERGETVLYVTGEESLEQIKIRADRLGVVAQSFLVVADNQLERIVESLATSGATVVVLDSAQSVASATVDSYPGSVTQVRHVAAAFVETVKRSQSACFLVGHVTKDGTIAGPKLLEHMVDTVLYFEGDHAHSQRILRAAKNRFGSVSEIGVFEMTETGLREVTNPSEFFLSERPEGVSGSVVSSVVEGSRPILTEIQALVCGPVAGSGRRNCLGVDPQRLALMLAVIEKKLGFVLSDQDIFVNAVGGVRAVEPSVDLGIVASILSSFSEKIIPFSSMVFGEVGLSGEVRPVAKSSARIHEAIRLGYSRIIGPTKNLGAHTFPKGVRPLGVTHIRGLADVLFE